MVVQYRPPAWPAKGSPSPGWCAHRGHLERLLCAHRPQRYVELGSWRGLSATIAASHVKTWGGTVTCVDTWAGGTKQGPSKAGDRRYPHMIRDCAEVLVRDGVAPWVRLVVSQTADAAEAWTEPIDFLYIDADHSERGCLDDLTRWVPHVRAGGIICGDDYDNPGYPGVARAWDRYEVEHAQPWIREDLTSAHEGRFVWGVKR